MSKQGRGRRRERGPRARSCGAFEAIIKPLAFYLSEARWEAMECHEETYVPTGVCSSGVKNSPRAARTGVEAAGGGDNQDWTWRGRMVAGLDVGCEDVKKQERPHSGGLKRCRRKRS